MTTTQGPGAGESQAPPAENQQLFEALDGRALRVGHDEWHLKVYGVIETGELRWVQLSLDGSALQVLTLRLEKTQGPGHAVTELSRWLANPTIETTNVLPRVA